MIISELFYKYKKLLIISVVTSVMLGAIATAYPISYVANLSIPNSEGYFSLAELKRIKNRLPIEAPVLVEREVDAHLKKLLKSSILEPRWIEKNITPNFALTKADARELIDVRPEKFDPYFVTWLNIQTTSKDEALAQRAGKWIAEALCRISYKQQLENHIHAIRAESDKKLTEIYSRLPAIEKSLDQMRESIRILRDINQRYPEASADQSKLQLNLSAGEHKDNLNNLSNLMAYFPPMRQLAILETQLALTIDEKKRLGFDRQLAEVVREAASTALEAFDQISTDRIFDNKKITYNFWNKVDFDKLLTPDLAEWQKKYVQETSNALREAELISAAHFQRQMSQLDGIVVGLKHSQLLLVLGGVIAGLLLPILLYFMPSLWRRLSASMSNGEA